MIESVFGAPLSLTAIGVRLRDVATKQAEIESRNDEAEWTSPKLQRLLNWTSSEQDALRRLGLVMDPRSRQDVAVQLGLVFAELVEITTFELESQVKSGALEETLCTMKRTMARIVRHVCKETGIDPADVVGDLPEVLAFFAITELPPLEGSN